MDLRVEIAEHLRRMRGLITDPSRIIVTAGAREGLTLLLRTFNRAARIGVESPGYPSLRRVPQVLGYDIVDLPTDASGLVVENLPTDLDAVRHPQPPVSLRRFIARLLPDCSGHLGRARQHLAHRG